MAFWGRRGVRIALGASVLGLVAAAVGSVAFYFLFMRDLPNFESIADYRPPIVSEVFDREGRLIAEFAVERRRVVPLEEIPELTRLAFIAAEDGAFYEHRGIDYVGIVRAALVNLRSGGEKRQGASTITQQMVKTLLLSPEQTYTRKIREAILSLRIERTFTKDEILYLYLNQIYFGDGAYGIAEAARSYFSKTPNELTVSESALLAGLPKAPSSYAPWRNPASAEKRRRYVLERMREEGIIDVARYEEELASPPVLARPSERENFAPSAYFTELVRRYLYDRFGGDRVLRGGLQVHTSLDLDLQIAAVASIQKGLESHDHRQGYRGPARQVDPPDFETTIAALGESNGLLLDFARKNAAPQLADPSPDPTSEGVTSADVEIAMGQGGDEATALPSVFAYDTPYEGVVVAIDRTANTARIALAPGVEGEVDVRTVRWAREPDIKTRGAPVEKIEKVFAPGDVTMFVRLAPDADERETESSQEDALPRLALHQVPVVQGAILSIENTTGDVLALVGGYDFEESSFDRVTQAHRQPGSSFKPFIYGAAISKGHTATSLLIDRPIVYTDPVSGWKYKPRNYGRKFYGPMSMRRALAKSINNATVHLFRDIGVDYVIDYARRFGIESALNRDLSLALGSSTVTLLELTRAYAIYPNGGRRVVPRYITLVTGRDGEGLLEDIPLGEPPAPVLQPLADSAAGEPDLEPYPDGEILPTDRVVSEAEAYLMADMLQAVVTEGTGRGLRRLGGYLAGKTGTTNDQADAWFMGFSPAITTGVWVGHDQVRPLGFGETGAGAALPIWRDYMLEALRRYPVRDYPVPEGIVEVRIDPATGLLAGSRSQSSYFQPFVEGTEPSERASERISEKDAERRMRSEAF